MSEGIKDPFQNFIALSRYARWIPEEGRREVWPETVDRAVNFFDETLEIEEEVLLEVRASIVNQKVMPSMRLLMTAGEALKRNHIAAYNCSFVPVDHLRAFDEALYILMQGTGLGFSVAKKYVNKLPAVAESFHATDTTIVVADSKEGWAKAYKELINLLWSGQKPLIDITKVRPAGARLKTFGGRASGPEPLLDLFEHTSRVVEGAAGRQITSLEAHSIVCKIAAVVVVGGVRRSALISLSDLEDREMAYAKVGAWYEENGHYALANNSAIYYKKPSVEQFMHEWLALVESKSGERGIFNLEASQAQASKNGRRDGHLVEGTNPCAEILLRPYEFCNLTEVIVEADDTLETLSEKVRTAALIGTWQSSLTDFKYIRKVWKDNVEEERLLGVSLTGQFGHKILSGSMGTRPLIEWLEELKRVAVETNKAEAARLGIPQSAAVTCVKPSGTVSQLNGVSSGMHPWHNDFYIRTVRGDNKDPLTRFLTDAGVPAEPDVMNPDSTTVFSFPMKAPEGAITRKDLTAIEHLEIWLAYQRHWCEHKPSVTISVKDDEWLEVGAWVYKHFDEMSGVSFLPFSEHTYKQAPYQDITETDYNQLAAEMPKDIHWSDLSFYESDDEAVNGSQEMACAAGGCDIVDIPSK